MSEEEVRRLRWHCRRGLLENDLVLERYLARYADSLDRPRLTALASLLELGDPELWDILSGRAQVREPQLADVVAELRAV